jgi:hypothetical protein
LYECFHVCLFVLIYKLPWHPPCTNFVILRSLWMMEYVDPQLMFNLLAISVAVICMSSWTSALTHSTLSNIHEVVTWPKWSSSTTLVLPLWTVSTHWYNLLCIMKFSPYCANNFLWI